MRNSMFSRFGFLVAALACALALLGREAQAQTGKLTGIVTDAGTGQPVEGAQVFLQGTGYGSVTQPNGRYFIIAIPPGNYTVLARRIGYQTQQTTTSIPIDGTREQNFSLASSSTQLAAVRVIETQRPLVELSQTGTTQQVTSEELEVLPVRSIKEALTLQPGFQEIPIVNTDLSSFTSTRRGVTPFLIRGGRAGETLTLIDGIPINNFLFGGPTLDLTRKAVETVAVFKGGLEPQYGNALSGVVSIATKEGGTNLAGSIEYETSRFGGSLGNELDELKGYDFVEGFLSGPVPATGERLRFLVAGRTQNEAGRVLEYDNKVYNPFVTDTADRFTYRADLIPGWRAQGFQAQRDAFGKLTYYFRPTTKLSLGLLHYEREVSQIPFDWLFTGLSAAESCIALFQARYGQDIDVVDVCNTAYSTDQVRSDGRPNLSAARNAFVNPAVISQRRDLYTAKFDHTLGRLNYAVVGGFFDQKRQTCATYFSGICLAERIADTNFNNRFAVAGVTSTEITPTEGTDEIAGNDKLRTWLVRADAQLQATDHHNLGVGIFYQGHDVLFREVRDVGLNNIVLQPSDYAAKPWDAAAYIQDRIEYDFLTVRLGARFDYGRASGTFLNDPLDPTNGTTMETVCTDPQRFGLPPDFGRYDSSGVVFTGLAACSKNRAKGDSATAIAFEDDMGKAPTRRAFSPRLGISFPITDKSSAFFNFGVLHQNPLYNNVYQGTAIGTPLEGDPAGPAFTAGTFVGNPQLRAEQTTSYEVGYVAEFARNLSVQVVAFTKDQSGLTGVRRGGVNRETNDPVFDPGVTYGTNAPNYTILVNQDYQTVRGFEMELRRRLANFWSARLNYGFSQATTNAAPPDLEEQQTQEEGDVPARSEIRSDIDQNHSANATLTFQVQDQTPRFRGGSLLRHSALSLTMRLSSGFPYTPALTFTGGTRDRLERNSGTAPTTFRIDVEANKQWAVANVRYGAFVRIVNLLDRKNCIQVFSTTGNCDGGASPQARLRAGNFTGESEGTTFFDRPHYQGARRSVNAGVRVIF